MQTQLINANIPFFSTATVVRDGKFVIPLFMDSSSPVAEWIGTWKLPHEHNMIHCTKGYSKSTREVLSHSQPVGRETKFVR